MVQQLLAEQQEEKTLSENTACRGKLQHPAVACLPYLAALKNVLSGAVKYWDLIRPSAIHAIRKPMRRAGIVPAGKVYPNVDTRKEKVLKKACNDDRKIDMTRSLHISQMVNSSRQLVDPGEVLKGVADKPFFMPFSLKFPDFFATVVFR